MSIIKCWFHLHHVHPLHHHLHDRQIPCQPLSSLPQQSQSHPHAAAAAPMTALTFCVIFMTWWISSTNWFIKKNHCLGTPRSTWLSFTVHSHKSLLQTRGLLAVTSHLDTVLNNNLDQNVQVINWRRLRECRTYDHVRSSAISSWRFESYGELSTLQSSPVWLWSMEDHAVATEKHAHIRNIRHTALHSHVCAYIRQRHEKGLI